MFGRKVDVEKEDKTSREQEEMEEEK